MIDGIVGVGEEREGLRFDWRQIEVECWVRGR